MIISPMAYQDHDIKRPELIAGDTKFRYKWFTALSIFILFPIGLLLALPSVKEHLPGPFSINGSTDDFRFLVVYYSLFSILAMILFTAGLQLILAARKSLQCGYFPAPGTRLIRDTWLISGTRAKYFSYLLTLTGVLFFIAGVYVPYFFHTLLIQLLLPVG